METALSFLSENAPTNALIVTLIAVGIIVLTSHLFSASGGPGPWGYPILGFYPRLRNDYHIQLIELAKKYGDAYFVSICGTRFLHLSSSKAMREVHVKKANDFSGRSREFSLMYHLFQDGPAFSAEEPWRVLRKFLIQSMKELGLGAKKQLKEPLLDSVQSTVDILQERGGKPIDVDDLCSVQCLKVIQRFIVGDVSEDTSLKLKEGYFEAVLSMGGTGLLLVGNLARYLIGPRVEGFNKIFGAKEKLDTLLNAILEEHKSNFNPNDPRDFIDMFLYERKTREDKGDPQAQYFTDKALVSMLIQMYGDAGIGIGLVLARYVKDLAQKKDIQDAMHGEIIQKIGDERLPTYEDRVRLPYVNAVIKELERTCSFLKIIPTLLCERDTIVFDVHVPKGTIALVNFHSIHNDPNIYRNPEKFDPTRFLPSDNAERPKEEFPVTFGLGKRVCPGENLVTTDVFIFLTALIQNFTLQLAAGTESKLQTKMTNDCQDAMGCNIITLPRKS